MAAEHEKILPFEGCERRLAEAKAQGRRIVHCHGTFDLLHPGHVKHLEEARREGDLLVVTVTSAPHVNKGPDRPVFSDEERAYQLAHLASVDFVVVVPKPGAVEIIERVRPHVYCKGAEYAAPGNETDRRIDEDAAAVERVGGVLRFVGQPLHSSTRLASSLGILNPDVTEFLTQLPADTPGSLDAVSRRIGALKVLVVGDLIVDRYTYCHVDGLTSKARVLSVRPRREEDHLGGSLAVARHIASFGCTTRILAFAGTEPWLDRNLEQVDGEGIELELLRSDDYTTILKQRFLEQPGVRRDLRKFFAVSHIEDGSPEALRDRLLERLRALLPEYDLIVACDYGHGLVGPKVQALLEDASPFLALNCQTNSANHGFNLVSKYRRCDLLSLDERELALACGTREGAESDRLERLARQLSCSHAWLTLGSSGSLAWTPDGRSHACPAMTREVVDTVGAGDAFFAVAALCARAGADTLLASLLANTAGALATRYPGNRQAIARSDVFKNVRFLLKSASDQVQRGDAAKT